MLKERIRDEQWDISKSKENQSSNQNYLIFSQMFFISEFVFSNYSAPYI